MIALYIILIYGIQIIICATIHIILSTKIPVSTFDFLKLTFLPYILWNWKKFKEGKFV